MKLHQYMIICLSYFLFGHPLSSTAIQSSSSEQSSIKSDLSSEVHNPSNKSSIYSGSFLANLSASLEFFTVTWPITDTLSLKANIGNWQYTPERILETLEAAAKTVGKKRAEALLDQKFTQKQGSRINRMLFEIGPGYTFKSLTWGDVGCVLSEERGLPKFFEEYGLWTSTYFTVMDSVRGELGSGAVRKYYHLEPPNSSNTTRLTASS